MDCKECKNWDECYNSEVLDLIRQHRKKAEENTETAHWFLENAEIDETVYGSNFMEKRKDSAILHTSSAEFLLNYTTLLNALRVGYSALIKCPVCGSCEVDIEIGNSAMNHACMDCEHEWDFFLE